MPCFSASNIRFVGQRPPPFTAKDRARTAARTSVSTTATQRQCEEIFYLKGLELGKPPQRYAPPVRGKQRAASAAHQAMLPQKEFERLKTASKVVTVEERLDALMRKEQEVRRLDMEADKTRERFKRIDEDRKRAEEKKLQKEDLFGAGEKVKVMERAFLAKQEQEEEVKRVNRIILNAKCHAIRDAQVQEKHELGKQQRAEDIRLEQLVIDNATKALDEEDKKFEQQKELRHQYANDIRKQLNERENLRFIEAERIEEEAKRQRKAAEAIKRDDERQAQLARERRQKLREELARIAEMSNIFKKMLCEQEREAEMRVAAYMREKQQRERALQVEKQRTKEEFERKQQRIFTLAQKIMESKSKREETGYLKEQERIEREYRRKEKEAALRKRQIEKELTDARLRQLHETKHRQALQIARAEQDFNALAERLQQQEAKEKELAQQLEQRRSCYRNDIIQQMTDKELARRRMLELERTRAMAWRESERQRDVNIRAVINAKMAAMREACLPEKYIKDVEKQLQKVALTRKVLKEP